MTSAIESGAKLVYQSDVPEGTNYYPVTVLADVGQDMEITRLAVGEYTARLPSASCCFLLLLVSPARLYTLYTHVAVNFRRLPPSPSVSQCLQPV